MGGMVEMRKSTGRETFSGAILSITNHLCFYPTCSEMTDIYLYSVILSFFFATRVVNNHVQNSGHLQKH